MDNTKRKSPFFTKRRFFKYLFIVAAIILTCFLISITSNHNTLVPLQSSLQRLSLFLLGSSITFGLITYNRNIALSASTSLKPNCLPILILLAIFSAFLLFLSTSSLSVTTLYLGPYLVKKECIYYAIQLLLLASTIFFFILLYYFISSFNIFHLIESNKKVLKNHLRKDTINLKLVQEQLPIHNQQIKFILNTYDDKHIQQCLLSWIQLVSTIQHRIFRRQYQKEVSIDEIKRVYLQTLNLTKDLIFFTSKKHELEEAYKKLINLYFMSLSNPPQNPKQADFFNIIINYLISDYFKQLFLLIYKLQSTTDPFILRKIARHELKLEENIIDLLNLSTSNKTKQKVYNHWIDLLLSLIFIDISKNKKNLQALIGMLFKAELQKSSVHFFNQDMESKSDSKVLQIFDKHSEQKEKEKNINKLHPYSRQNEIIAHLIIALVKACELSNYEASGYLTKQVIKTFDKDSIVKVIRELKNLVIVEDSKIVLSTATISINTFSLNYCLKKAIILLDLQLTYKQTLSDSIYHEFPHKLLTITEEELEEITDSLDGLYKDYRLQSIKDKHIKRYLLHIKHSKQKNISNNKKRL